MKAKINQIKVKTKHFRFIKKKKKVFYSCRFAVPNISAHKVISDALKVK